MESNTIEAIKTTPTGSLLQTALSYAKLGWAVLPLHTPDGGVCSCGNSNCDSSGKHPRTSHGLKDATTNCGLITEWWKRWPDANIGIATGPASGLIVLDIDGPIGEDSLSIYDLPDTVEQQTGRGRHLFFTRPGAENIKNITGLFGPGSNVDLKADNGYVVAPPSRHRKGQHYMWEFSSDPTEGHPIAEAPAWLLELIAPEGKKVAAQVDEMIAKGARNSTLTSLAGSMRRRGMSEEAILAALQAENKCRCAPPLPAHEVESIATSICKYPSGEPKRSVSISPERRFKLVRACDIEAKPPQWVVKGLLERDALTQVFGDPGCGKSFWAIDIALCVSTGTAHHGHAVEKGAVIYIAGEGQNGLKRRFMAWSKARGVSHDDAPLLLSTMPTALTDAEQVTIVEEAIAGATAKYGPPVLVVIDTVARNFGPADENSTQDMNRFIQAADQIRAGHKSTMLLVHHTGHGDKTRGRGAMALLGGLDASYMMDKDESGTIRLEAKKMKEAEKPKPLAFLLHSVELPIIDSDTGEIITSAALKPTNYEPREKKGKEGRGKHQRRTLEILDDLYATRQEAYDKEGLDTETIRLSIADWKKAMLYGGIPSKRISEVMASLYAAGLVRESNGFIFKV